VAALDRAVMSPLRTIAIFLLGFKTFVIKIKKKKTFLLYPDEVA
jgi:hypothetical protein